MFSEKISKVLKTLKSPRMIVSLITLLVLAAIIMADRVQWLRVVRRVAARGVPLAVLVAASLWALLLVSLVGAATGAGWVAAVQGWGQAQAAALLPLTGTAWAARASAWPQMAVAALAAALTWAGAKGRGPRWRPATHSRAALALAWGQASFMAP